MSQDAITVQGERPVSQDAPTEPGRSAPELPWAHADELTVPPEVPPPGAPKRHPVYVWLEEHAARLDVSDARLNSLEWWRKVTAAGTGAGCAGLLVLVVVVGAIVLFG